MRHTSYYDIKELGFVPPRYGGVSVSIARLIDKLSYDGFSVGGFYTNENTDPKITSSEKYDPELNLSTKFLIFRLYKYLRILRPYKILHSHYSLEHMDYMWCFLRFLRKKLIITIHNSMVQSSYLQCTSINRFFLKRVACHPNVIWVAVSEQAKEEMLKLPVTFRTPIYVIPAYIPDTRIEQEALSPALYDYLGSHHRNVAFYGHSFMLHEGKDIYGFMEALSMYQRILSHSDESIGFILCLAEDWDTVKIEELHRLAKSLRIDDKVFWQIGPIRNMNALWDRTDVYVRPTCTDGDSVAVREALDMGVQVVASDVCARPKGSICYKYGDLDDFVKKVSLCLTRGKGLMKPDYSNYIAIKEIYNQLLNR